MLSQFGSDLHWNLSTDYSMKQLIVQQLIFDIQNSTLCHDFIKFSTSLKNVPVVDSEFCEPINDDNVFLPYLEEFLTLCDSANKATDKFISSISEAFALQFLSQDFTELQSTISYVLIPNAVRNELKPIFYVVLNLLLDSVEIEQEETNVFRSVLLTRSGDYKNTLVEKYLAIVRELRWFSLDDLFLPNVVSFVKSALTHRIRSLCCNNYSERLLDGILLYNKRILQRCWIPKCFSHKAHQLTVSRQLSDEMIFQLFFDIRKPDLFSLIIEFPDSVNALLDLGKCVDRIPLRKSLISHLTEEVKQRLLHPGVHTEQILVAYSYLVRALRIVDRSYLVQDVVCRPVSLCLRQREDAVRCIVDKLLASPQQGTLEMDDATGDDVGGSAGELRSELLLRKPLEVAPVDRNDDSDSEVVFEDPAFDDDTLCAESESSCILPGWGSCWQPDPIEAIHQGGQWRRRMDLLSLLVSIYGSKKAFLIEYKQLLSQRLLKQRSFQIAHDLRNLELLKLRFGEQNLVDCEVMLKDIRDSKRIASLVAETNQLPNSTAPSSDQQPAKSGALAKLRPRRQHSDKNAKCSDPVDDSDRRDKSLFPLSAFILSLHYWPELLDEKMKLPTELQHAFDNYERSFQRLKGNRKLLWMHKLGLVNIELELGDRSVQLDVTPLQASLIHMFTKKVTWTVRELAQELEAPISAIRNSLQAFIQLGFLRNPDVSEVEAAERQSDTFEVCNPATVASTHSMKKSTGTSSTSQFGLSSTSGTEEHEYVTSTREKKEKELQVFWSYIVAMLTNLGGLSLDRIDSMLRMFALGSTSSLECNRDELRQFLERKIHDSELIYDGDVYRLSKLDV